MTQNLSTPTSHRPDDQPASPPPEPLSRGWIVAGIGAAVASIAMVVVSSGLDAVYAPETKNNPARIADAILDSANQFALFHTVTAVAALLLVVFAAGLRLQLTRWTPATSVLPVVAFTGLVLTSTVQLIGTSLDTEFTQGARGNIIPEAITFYGHWVNTVSWYWAGAGLTALALVVAGFRHAAPRWLAVVSLILGVPTTLFAISPLEYMAAFSGALWLLIVTVGLLLSARRKPATTS